MSIKSVSLSASLSVCLRNCVFNCNQLWFREGNESGLLAGLKSRVRAAGTWFLIPIPCYNVIWMEWWLFIFIVSFETSLFWQVIAENSLSLIETNQVHRACMSESVCWHEDMNSSRTTQIHLILSWMLNLGDCLVTAKILSTPWSVGSLYVVLFLSWVILHLYAEYTLSLVPHHQVGAWALSTHCECNFCVHIETN